MSIIAHTMQYIGGEMPSPSIALRRYLDMDYPIYREVYNDCFEVDNKLAGSVAIYGNEIDDLIVARQYQRKGYGQGLLRFAVARMQRGGIFPIMLHVADWNRGAIELYTKNGFCIIKTETV